MSNVVKGYILLLMLFVISPSSYDLAFGHGVHSGVLGCPVNACGITDWSKLEFVKDVTFQSSLIIYCLILSICLVSISSVHRAKIKKNQ